MSGDALIAGVERYYSEKITQHGPTPQGVDWNSEAGQSLRFGRLLALIADADERPSINDYGCGYGSLVDALVESVPKFSYTGFDVSEPMVEAARGRYGDRPGVRFINRREDLVVADFTLASGIFNVRLEQPPDAWESYVLATIDDMVAVSRRGVAFNALTFYSDGPHMRPDLHYADPGTLLDHCLRRHSRNVVLDHNYDLYEFTLRVRLDGRPPAR
jgi:SAM-dependent methyltransferase